MALAPPKEQPIPQHAAQSSEATDLRQCLNCNTTGRLPTALLGQDGITVELLLTCRSSKMQLLFTAPIRLPLVSPINGVLCTRDPSLAPRGWAVPPLQRLRRLPQHPSQKPCSARCPHCSLSLRLGAPRPALHHHLAQANLGQLQQMVTPETVNTVKDCGAFIRARWSNFGCSLADLSRPKLPYLHLLVAVISQV